MPTNEERFIRRQLALIREANKLDDVTIKKIIRHLRTARVELAARLSSVQLDNTNLAAIKQMIDQEIRIFDNAARAAIAADSEKAFFAGSEITDSALSLTDEGKRILQALPAIDDSVLIGMTNFSGDLITGVSNDLRKNINTQIFLGVQGELPLNEVINNIGTSIKKGVFRSAKARAEFVTRTEINRVLSVSQDLRAKEIAIVAPKTEKFWLTAGDGRVRKTHVEVGAQTNPASGGTPIGINKDFIVGGFPAKGPYDPRLPAKEVVNCRCRRVLVMRN